MLYWEICMCTFFLIHKRCIPGSCKTFTSADFFSSLTGIDISSSSMKNPAPESISTGALLILLAKSLKTLEKNKKRLIDLFGRTSLGIEYIY